MTLLRMRPLLAAALLLLPVAGKHTEKYSDKILGSNGMDSREQSSRDIALAGNDSSHPAVTDTRQFTADEHTDHYMESIEMERRRMKLFLYSQSKHASSSNSVAPLVHSSSGSVTTTMTPPPSFGDDDAAPTLSTRQPSLNSESLDDDVSETDDDEEETTDDAAAAASGPNDDENEVAARDDDNAGDGETDTTSSGTSTLDPTDQNEDFPTPFQTSATEYPFASASETTTAPTLLHWSNPENEWQPHNNGEAFEMTPTRYHAPAGASLPSPASFPTVVIVQTVPPVGGSLPANAPASSPHSDATSNPTFASVNPSPSIPFMTTSGPSTRYVRSPASLTSGNLPTTRSSPSSSNSNADGSPSRATFEPSAPPTIAENGFDGTRANRIYSKCGVWPKRRTNLLLNALETSTSKVTSTDDDELSNPFSPQYKAFAWVNDEDEAMLCADNSRLEQRYTMAVVYFALNDHNWTNCQADSEDNSDIGACVGEDGATSNARWLSGASECSWYGVSCNANERVTKLTLKNNNLAGTLPTELFTSLPLLSSLSLDRNKKISGTIPSIMNLTSLTIIELDDNSLSGSFPDAFYSMTTLKAIDLKENQLTGTISDDIGDLRELMVLQLQDNQFYGALPSNGLAQLSSMLLLTLHGNQFTGSTEPICTPVSVVRETSPEYLQFFSTDCASVVECSCCSACF
ncbi:hypothetical protein MPSEU_000992800 [Mayamaea pseudoterrestris]|nr:hypothetical protein MPSEU_000992800 [Mayamaea pseudoterrestris]